MGTHLTIWASETKNMGNQNLQSRDPTVSLFAEVHPYMLEVVEIWRAMSLVIGISVTHFPSIGRVRPKRGHD